MASVQFQLSVSQQNATALEGGYMPNATNNLDTSLGEAELPPLPPSGVEDFRFVGFGDVDLGQGSLIDYRDEAIYPDKLDFRFQAQYASSGTPTLEATVPAGFELLIVDNVTEGSVFTQTFPEGTDSVELPTNVNLFNVQFQEV